MKSNYKKSQSMNGILGNKFLCELYAENALLGTMGTIIVTGIILYILVSEAISGSKTAINPVRYWIYKADLALSVLVGAMMVVWLLFASAVKECNSIDLEMPIWIGVLAFVAFVSTPYMGCTYNEKKVS